MSRLGHVGSGILRNLFVKDLQAGTAARWASAGGDEWQPSSLAEREAAERAKVDVEKARQEAEEILASDTADLDREENAAAAETAERRASGVAAQIPKALAVFLDDMDPVMRRKRETAILEKIGWNDLPLSIASAEEVAELAAARAARYAREFPASDPRFQTPEHRRGRDEAIQRRRLRKQAKQIRSYIGQAVRGVGGKDAETRQIYVTDYSVERHRDDVRQSHENMERLRIVMLDKPTVQIPMIDAHRRKMEREAAKKRLLIDVMLKRAEAIGARAVWTTITLPGRFHSNPTNAGHEAEEWDPMLGPAEQMKEMQHRYHQTMNLLRELDCRPWGFWAAQAQQDGTVHRHLEDFVHDREMTEWEALALLDPDVSESAKTRIREESEERVLQEAREIATRFRQRFPGVHGCRAEVIGDTHPDFKPRTGKDGSEETAASIAKYTARYATRLAMGAGENFEVSGGTGDDEPARPVTDMERHAVWASERDARLLNFVGMDSRRSPSRAWDCIWKAVDRGERPDNARMELAVENMVAAQNYIDELIEKRAELADAQARVKALGARATGGIEREIKRLDKRLKEELAAPEPWEYRLKSFQRQITALRESLAEPEARQAERLEQAEAVVVKFTEEIAGLNDLVATYAYQSCLAFGLWADRDLHVSERLWLRAELRLKDRQDMPLPPVPLRRKRDNAFGETVRETVGIAAPVVIAAGTAENKAEAVESMEDGMMMLTGENGAWTVVAASEDPARQILLKAEEWVIVDKETAAEMVREMEAAQDAREKEAQEQDEEMRLARMRAYQEEREALESEGTGEDFEESDGVRDSDLDSEHCGACGCETFRLSLIATDPRKGPDGPPHEEKEPPG